MSRLVQDLRCAVRSLVRSPGFTLVAVGVLALGIGATSAIFSFVEGIVLSPLGYRDPGRLVMVWLDWRGRGGPEREWFSWPDYQDFRAQSETLEELAVITDYGPTLSGRGDAERLNGALVSHSMLDLLGIEPAAGRGFVESEENPGGERVAVIGDSLRRRLFAGEDAVGATLILDGEPHTVIGVMPPGFRLPVAPLAEIYTPLRPAGGAATRGRIWLRAVGRLAPGATLERARADLATVAARLAAEHPQSNSDVGAAVYPLLDETVGPARRPLAVLLAAVGAVLLIACANLANLLLARASGRGYEMALRSALGAGRGALVRQLLTESLLLAFVGGALGLLVASEGIDLLKALLGGLGDGAPVPRLDEVGLDPRVVAFTAALTVLTGLAFGLAPALRASRPDLDRVLRAEGGRAGTGGGRRLRSALVVAETALAVALLTTAGLLLQSFFRLQAVDPGFHPAGTLAVDLAPPAAAYDQPERVAGFYRDLLARLAALPGVESVAATSVPPLGGRNIDLDFSIEGRPPPEDGRDPVVWVRIVTPGYFETLGLPVVAGRALEPRDSEGEVLGGVVNRAFAERHFPGESPLGERLSIGPWTLEIIGVAADVKNWGLTADERPALYAPHAPTAVRAMTVVLRTAAGTDAIGLLPAVRRAVAEIDPTVAVAAPRPLDRLIAVSIAPQRVVAVLLAAFAAAAALLAAIGLYGVLSYAAARGTREIGIRLALGARPRAVERQFVGRGMALALAGLALGLALALGAGRVVSSLLFEVEAGNPAVYAGAAALLIAAALLASWLPARRAARTDPLAALREG